MRKVLKGKDFMVFADGKAVALATNHHPEHRYYQHGIQG